MEDFMGLSVAGLLRNLQFKAADNPAHHRAEIISGTAHIVVSIDQAGKATLRSFFGDRFDASYAAMPDDRLLQRELPKLLDELRGQIQGLSGSAVTE